MKTVTKLLIFCLFGLVIGDRAIAQADNKPSPGPPDATEKTGSASKDTVIQAKDSVVQQKATANPMKLSNPENVQTKRMLTPEQEAAEKSRKKYEKQQRKAQKKAGKEHKKTMHESAKTHSHVN